MKKLYARFIGWLIAPALKPLKMEIQGLRASLAFARTEAMARSLRDF